MVERLSDIKQQQRLDCHTAGMTDYDAGLKCGLTKTGYRDWRVRNNLPINRKQREKKVINLRQRLTDEQKTKITRMVTEGKQYYNIARILDICEGTVKNYVYRIISAKDPKRKTYLDTSSYIMGGYKPTGRPMPPVNKPSDMVVIHSTPEEVNAGLKQRYGSRLMDITQSLGSRRGSSLIGSYSIGF